MGERHVAIETRKGYEEPAVCGPVCVSAGACVCGAEREAVGGVGAGWAPEACALAEAERPGREQEFAALFAAALRAVARPMPTVLDVVLDPGFAGRARDLARRESGCCSFFDFAFTDTPAGLAWTIAVPAAQVEVLDALGAAAFAAHERADS